MARDMSLFYPAGPGRQSGLPRPFIGAHPLKDSRRAELHATVMERTSSG